MWPALLQHSSRFRGLWPWLLAVAAGLVWALPFGIRDMVLVPWIALVPLLLLLGTDGVGKTFLLGWLAGTVHWLAAIPWIIPTLETYGGMPRGLAVLLLLALALYLGLYLALFAGLGSLLWRHRSWRRLHRGGGAGPGSKALDGLLVLAGLPALWVALELLRGWTFSGFPWNLAAYAWTEVPGALPASAWIGAWGVSALVVLANVGIARAIAEGSRGGGRRWQWAAVGLGIPLLVLPVAGRWAAPLTEAERVGAGAPVRILQPDIANQAEYDPVRAFESYRGLLELSRQACDRPGALVIWPESAAWPYSWGRDPQLRRDLAALVARGCPVLFNSVRVENEGLGPPAGAEGELVPGYYNSVYLLSDPALADRGSGQAPEDPPHYDKRHLVPFGEYVPGSGLFAFMDRLARNAGDFSAAEEVHLLGWAGERLGLAICFEVVFPAEVAELVQEGATLLVTVTNDAWYGDTAAPRQHFRAARFRAAETGRTLLRAAITGISAVVAPDGSLVSVLEVGERGVIPVRVSGRRDLTPFAARPRLVPWLAVLLAALALGFVIIERLRGAFF